MESVHSLNYEDFKRAIDRFLEVTTNEELKAVEKTLNELTNAPESIACILRAISAGSYSLPVQKMLAVLLKKAVLRNHLRLSVENRKAAKTQLLEAICAGRSSSGYINKLAEAYAYMLKIEHVPIHENSEFKAFLQTYCNFASKDGFLKSLIVVQNVAEQYPNGYSAAEVGNLVTLIEQVFGTGYDASNGEIYLNALKTLFSFTNVILAQEDVEASQVSTFVQKLLAILSGYFNIKGVFDEDAKEANNTLTIVFETLTDAIEFHIDKMSQANVINLIEFIISDGCLNNEEVDLGTKNAAVECLDTLLNVEPKYFNPKKTQILEKVLKVYSALLVQESVQTTQQIAQNPSCAIDIYQDNKLSDLLFYSIELFSLKFKTKNTNKLIKQMIVNWLSTGHIDLCLRLLSATAQALCHHLVKELDQLVHQIILPGLKQPRVDITIFALKTLCYFCEFLSPDILEYKDSWLEILVSLLRSVSSSQVDQRTVTVVTDNSLLALEIIIENSESEDVGKYSMDLIQLVSEVMYTATLSETTKKTAIGTLAAIFSSSEQTMLAGNVDKLIGVLEPYTHHDFYVGEAMIALSRLAYYSYKDTSAVQASYLAKFQFLLEKAYSIIKKVDNVDDYELYEGAFTVVYQAMELLGREASFVFDANMFFKWTKYLEDAKAEDMDEPESEREEESEESENHLLARLPFIHFCSAIVHYLGLCLRYFTEHIVTNASVDKEVQNFMIYRILVENEEERHQVYLCAFNYALGVRRILKSDATMFLLGLTETMLQNEPSESNISRNIELLNNYFSELTKDDLTYKPLSDANVTQSVINIVGTGVLKGMYEDQIDPEVFYSVCELITQYVRSDTSDNYKHLYRSLLQQLVLPCIQFETLECDISVIEEIYGSIGESIKAKPALLAVIVDNFNQNGQFEQFLLSVDRFEDEGVTRNGMFLIGTVFEHMRAPMFGSSDRIAAALQFIQGCYDKYELPALKDNCVSSFVKLYLNDSYAQLCGSKINDASVLDVIRSSVPLKGDDEESECMLKGLLTLASKGHSNAILAHKNMIVFIFECIAKHKTLALSDAVLKVATQFVSANQSNENLAAVFVGLTPQSQETIKSLLN